MSDAPGKGDIVELTCYSNRPTGEVRRVLDDGALWVRWADAYHHGRLLAGRYEAGECRVVLRAGDRVVT